MSFARGPDNLGVALALGQTGVEVEGAVGTAHRILRVGAGASGKQRVVMMMTNDKFFIALGSPCPVANTFLARVPGPDHKGETVSLLLLRARTDVAQAPDAQTLAFGKTSIGICVSVTGTDWIQDSGTGTSWLQLRIVLGPTPAGTRTMTINDCSTALGQAAVQVELSICSTHWDNHVAADTGLIHERVRHRTAAGTQTPALDLSAVAPGQASVVKIPSVDATDWLKDPGAFAVLGRLPII